MGVSKPHQALYRRYRSRQFADVVGQTHVTSTLAAAVKSGRVVHAYLFTGPHGTGKTSVARILAHTVNGLTYADENQHLDIIEIDAASNRGIDEVRELREKALLTPSSARYKVYIIDEVHMLTTPAFNALLKLLEEPPSHTIFILATTEVHKVPATIRSRSQWYGFRPISQEDIAEHLAKIAKSEKIKIDPAALQRIAEIGRGSLRDSIGILDQLSTETSSIDEQTVISKLGLVPDQHITELLRAIESNDWQSVRNLSKQAREEGYGAKQLASQIIKRLQSEPPAPAKLALIENLLTVATATDVDLALDIALVKSALIGSEATVAAAPPAPTAATQPQNNPAELDWSRVLADIKTQNNSLYAILRLAQPILEDDTLKLTFGFDFHKKQLEEERNQQILSKLVSTHVGRPIAIVSHVQAGPDTKSKPPIRYNQVIQVMGGGELSDYEEAA